MPTKKNSIWPFWLLIGLAVAGLVDALFLTVEHYSNLHLPCTITSSCEQVLNSQFATIFGIPTAAFGIVFYGVVLAMGIHLLMHPKTNLRFLMIWASLGFVASLILTGIQAFVLKAWCQYCLLSALSSTLIFVLITLLFRKQLLASQRSENGTISE